MIKFKCDCGIWHTLRFDDDKNFVGRDESLFYKSKIKSERD